MASIVSIVSHNPSLPEHDGEVYRHVFESEKVYVKDEFGYVEVFDTELVWCNPDIYIWTNSGAMDNCMCHFFDMVNPG